MTEEKPKRKRRTRAEMLADAVREGADSTPPAAPSPSPAMVELETEIAAPVRPKFKDVEKEAARELLRPPPTLMTDEMIGYMFKKPLESLTSVREKGAAPAKAPELTTEEERMLVRAWSGVINRNLLKLAGTKYEIVMAFLITLMVYAPKLMEAASYRRAVVAPQQKKYATDTQRGLEEAGLVPTREEAQDAFDAQLKMKMAGGGR